MLGMLMAGGLLGADGDEPADEQPAVQQHAHRDARQPRLPVPLQECLATRPAAASDAGPPGPPLVRLCPPSPSPDLHSCRSYSCHPCMSESLQHVSTAQHLSSGQETCKSTWRRLLSGYWMCNDGEWHLACYSLSWKRCALRHELLLQAAAEASAGAPNRLRGWPKRDQASAAAAARPRWQGRPESMGMLLLAELCC